jgi:type II secretory pathway component PulF
MASMIKDDTAIIEGGIYLILTVLLAMIVYILFLPILAVIVPQLEAINPATTSRFSGMTARLDTSIALFVMLPIFSIVIAAIFFIMRAIKKQGYSEYDQ